MRVLYCTGGGVGNVVMSTPAIAALHEMGYEVDVRLDQNAAPGIEELLSGWSAIGGTWRGYHNGMVWVPELLSNYDHIIHSVWSRTRPLYRGAKELAAPTDPGLLRQRHESVVNMIPLRNALDFTGETPAPHVEYDPPDRPATAPWYYVLGMGCKPDAFWWRKKWESWRELQAIFGAERCVYLGTREESRHWMGIDFCGATTLRRAAGWIAGARAYVGIDNGLAHVAAALGVPTVALFGATSEVKNRPLGTKVKVLTKNIACRPCQMTREWEKCRTWRCMDFEPAKVAAAVNALLHHGDTEARRTE